MALFKNAEESHQHSLEILSQLYMYDDFMDSIRVVADMGCGAGLDTLWWATLVSRDDPPIPHEYNCFAIDLDLRQFEPDIRRLPNVRMVQENFEDFYLPSKIDLMYCHDAFQYAINPLGTLRLWNERLNVNGMLVLSVPLLTSTHYNRVNSLGRDFQYYNYTPVTLLYMLAVNGFDCNDMFLRKKENDPWLNIAVYKTDVAPMDPSTTGWHQLAEQGLVAQTIVDSLDKNGYVKQDELLFRWLDKEFYRIRI